MTRSDSSTDAIRESSPSAPRRAGPTDQLLEYAIFEGEPPRRTEQVSPKVRRFLSPRRVAPVLVMAVVGVVAAWYFAQPEPSAGLKVKSPAIFLLKLLDLQSGRRTTPSRFAGKVRICRCPSFSALLARARISRWGLVARSSAT